jgi:hypothetical protein
MNEESKKAVLEYYQITKQIQELTKRRADLAKHLMPTMEQSGHKQVRLASEGGHIVSVRKSERPKQFNIKYIKEQLETYFGDAAKAEVLFNQLLNNRPIIQESRLVVKMASVKKTAEEPAKTGEELEKRTADELVANAPGLAEETTLEVDVQIESSSK